MIGQPTRRGLCPPPASTRHSPPPSAVVLAWDPSTDNVGVVGYGVYRSGGLLSVVNTSTPTVTLNGLSCGSTYQYAVDAVDAAGNRSARASAWVQTAGCSDS